MPRVSLTFTALQVKLNEEKLARQKAVNAAREKERKISVLTGDYREIQQRLQKIEGELKQKTEKLLTVESQLEQEHRKSAALSLEINSHSSEVTHLKSKEMQLVKEITQLRENERHLEDEISKIENTHNSDISHMKELQDQLESEQYFSRLYKTQCTELREENEEKVKAVQALEEKRDSLLHQLQIALARADSEALARSIAEETVADLEKEKTIKELEIKDLMSKHRNELSTKESALAMLREAEADITKKLNLKISEYDELVQLNNKLKEELAQNKSNQIEMDKLKAKLKNEILLKQTATHEIETMSVNLQQKDEESRRLQQELTQERDKYNELLLKYQEIQTQLNVEIQAKQKLQMEIECKETEIEQLQRFDSSETVSFVLTENDNEENQESVFEGWLSVPNKQNIRRHGWKRQYVVVSSHKIMFYNSDAHKLNASEPLLILDLSKVFHVRPVTQGDVIRADDKEIPRIFQIIYAGEGEASRPDDPNQQEMNTQKNATDERIGITTFKGHELVKITYHMPTACELCSRSLWHVFKPPAAYECKRCRNKIHKDHVDNNDLMAPCKLSHDPNSAREMVLLAKSEQEQQLWVNHLSESIQKYRYVSDSFDTTNTNTRIDDSKISSE